MLNPRFQVDDLQIDLGTRRVLRNGVDLGVTSLSFDLLLALVHAAPGLATFDSLLERVWPGVVVSPETLTQRVKLLRQSLDDSADNPRYILAVRGHGYRLAVPAVPLAPVPQQDVTLESVLVKQRWWLGVGALLVIAVAVAAWWALASHEGAQSRSLPDTSAAADAYQLFLQAEAVVNGTPESFRAAIALYDEALARDPDFARALSGRAMNRAALVWIGSPLARGLEAAQQDAEQALALDPADARAHVVLASLSAMRGEWSASEASFRAAIAVSPQDADVRARYALTLLLATGQVRKAAAEAAQGNSLAPANSFTSATLAFVNQALGEDDAATRFASAAESRGGDPRQMAPVHASAAARSGHYAEAANHAIKVLPPALRTAAGEATLQQAYAALGDPAKQQAALAALRTLTQEPAWERTDPRARQPVLYLYAAFDAQDDLYREMDQMLRGDSYPQIIAIGSLWSPGMRKFRQDRRFQELVERLRLIDYWKLSGPPDDCALTDSKLICN
ncbi:MAG: winged helix-turn-helix domain-containing protein [Pseudomonadota bacterium]